MKIKFLRNKKIITKNILRGICTVSSEVVNTKLTICVDCQGWEPLHTRMKLPISFQPNI